MLYQVIIIMYKLKSLQGAALSFLLHCALEALEPAKWFKGA
jgi:hypothetical protein